MSTATTADVPVTTIRTEVEVAADTVIALMHAGIVQRSAQGIRHAADAAGVTVADLKLAGARWTERLWRRPTRRDAPEHTDTVRRHGPNQQPDTRPRGKELSIVRTTDAKGRPKNPTPDTRRCNLCEQVKPRTAFNVKDRKYGGLRSECIDCQRAYQRGRYLSIKTRDALASVGIVLDTSSELIGLLCSGCGQPLTAGDHVQIEGAPHHATCTPGT